MISHLVRASVLALVTIGATATTAPARTPYDGAWSVLIVTQQGACDRAYRYGVEIVNGLVRYDGGGVNLSGRVGSNGAVQGSVSAGRPPALGSGRLPRHFGTGNWNSAH